MNRHAVEILEFDKIKEAISEYAISERGKSMISELEPAVDYQVIQHWLKETKEAGNIILKSSSVPLHHLQGIDNIIQKLGTGMNLTPLDLTNILGLLKNGMKLKRFMKEKESIAPVVSSYALSIIDLKELAEEIERAIQHEQVDDQATPRLSKIRKKIAVTEEKIKLKLDGMMKSSAYSDYLQENIISKRNGRYVIPIKSSHKNNIDGNLLDKSSSGSTVYIEPKVIGKLQEELNQLQYEEEEEVYQILTYLTGLVEANKQELSINIETMVHYDFLFAKAKYSKAIDGREVELNKEKYINIKGAKHPLIGKSAVPLDFVIGKDYSSLVITGPNTGGKTVTLKTVGLLTMMVQSGIQVPVEDGSSFTIFNDILVDIGDGQSIQQSLSTFSSHISNIITIMKLADPNTLIILDELGAGTDPSEGMGLAIAILESIHRKRPITIATTHYSEIKEFAEQEQGFANGSMEFDLITLQPTYKLNIGKSGESNAFLIALRLGMDKEIIRRAHHLTYKEEKDYDMKLEAAMVNQTTHQETTKRHLERTETANKQKRMKETVEQKKRTSEYKVGDAVFIQYLNTMGIICELENNKGELGVIVKKKKLKINKKRLSLYIEGKELYPEDYDMDIVIETKENRKKKKLMSRKYVKDVKIERKGEW